jgi:hypothetical protein
VFSRARHERFRESDALRRVFVGVVTMWIAAGLVGGIRAIQRATANSDICFTRPSCRCGYRPKIGAAWTNKVGRGSSLKLNLLPIGEADIVVREVESRSEGDARSCDSAAGSANDARRMNRPAIGSALASLTSSTDKFLRPLKAKPNACLVNLVEGSVRLGNHPLINQVA